MTLSRDALLADLALASRRPEGAAEFLGPAHYHSQAVFDLEMQRIFRSEWICAGRADALARTGDYLTTQLLDEPLLLVRREDGDLAAYSNVCRHHYYPVAEGSGNARAFTCPYHKWTYRLDGSLAGAPGMEGTQLDAATCRLPELRSEVWNGFVFINLDPEAQAFMPRIADLTARLVPYEFEQWTTSAIDDSTWHGNWKLTMENALETYHHMGLHEHSLQADLPGMGAEFRGDYGSWAHHSTPFSSDFAARVAAQVPKQIGRLAPEDRATLNIFYIYPSFVFAVVPTFANWISMMPIDLTQTRVYSGVALSEESRRSMEQEGAAADDSMKELIVTVNGEDRLATENLQRTTRSRYIERGTMNPRELNVLYYYRYLASKLVDGEPPDEHPLGP